MAMKLRILSADDVKACIDMAEAIEAMREAFRALAEGKAEVPLRVALETRHGVSLFMPAYLSDPERSAAKIVSVNPENSRVGLPAIHAVILAVDPTTGRPMALMDGTWLTALRTGAVGGLAADLLSREDSRVVALFGAGVQARTQLEAVRCVREIEEVRIVSRGGRSADVLAEELEGLEARRVDDPAEALEGADIVIAATSSATPVFPGSRVEEGAHVTGVGSYTTEMREVDTELVLRARVVVDEREAVLAEGGDIAGPIADGVVDASVMVAEIGDVVLDRRRGRTRADEVTFFKSVGNAVQDVAVASRVLARAERDQRGTVVEL